MQKKDTTILYSASDIVSFLDCEHKTTLDFIDLEPPLPKAEGKAQYIVQYLHYNLFIMI
jgi:uncharacterized protein